MADILRLIADKSTAHDGLRLYDKQADDEKSAWRALREAQNVIAADAACQKDAFDANAAAVEQYGQVLGLSNITYIWDQANPEIRDIYPSKPCEKTDFPLMSHWLDPIDDPESLFAKYKLLKCVEGCSSDLDVRRGDNGEVFAPFGLLGMLITAFNGHHGVIIKPGDLYVAILTQFSYYMRARAERLAKLIVAHEGKMDLVVDDDGGPKAHVVLKLAALVRANTIGPLSDISTPAYDTPQAGELVHASVTAMSVASQFFHYTYRTMCAIPVFGIAGTERDYEKLSALVDQLLAYNEADNVLADWCANLQKIIAGFIAAKRGIKDHVVFLFSIFLFVPR